MNTMHKLIWRSVKTMNRTGTKKNHPSSLRFALTHLLFVIFSEERATLNSNLTYWKIGMNRDLTKLITQYFEDLWMNSESNCRVGNKISQKNNTDEKQQQTIIILEGEYYNVLLFQIRIHTKQSPLFSIELWLKDMKKWKSEKVRWKIKRWVEIWKRKSRC